MECRFWAEIITNNQYNTLGKMLSGIPIKLQNLMQNNHTYVCYQDDIFVDEHRLFGLLQFGTTGINKLKYPNMIDKKQWNELVKEGRKNVTNTLDAI